MERSWNCNFPSEKFQKIINIPRGTTRSFITCHFSVLLSLNHVCAVLGTRSRMKRICSWWSTCCLEGTCATISNKMCGSKRELWSSSSVSWCWPLTTCREGTSSTGQPGHSCAVGRLVLLWCETTNRSLSDKQHTLPRICFYVKHKASPRKVFHIQQRASDFSLWGSWEIAYLIVCWSCKKLSLIGFN